MKTWTPSRISLVIRGGKEKIGELEEQNIVENMCPYVTRGREEQKRDTNDNCNPGEVQVHMWELEAAEVKEQDWGL